MELAGKTVLVTGASRGFGKSIAEAFAREGSHVIALGRDPEALASTRESLESIGSPFDIVQMDVRDESAVTAFMSELPALDVVVNNAGIARYQPLLETPTDVLREVLEINVVAAFVIMRESARKMLQTGGGTIINIASDAAIKGIGCMAPYVASKHALLGIGRCVSQEFRKNNIRVTTYCPGMINTEIFGPGTGYPSALDPDAIATTIVHIASLPEGVEVQEVLVEPMNM